MEQESKLMGQSDDNALGPWLTAPKSYRDLRASIRKALGFPHERRPLLIGIDGLDGAGKTSLASWLSWQLEMPAIHLDLYIVNGSKPLRFRSEDLAQTLDARAKQGRPLIVEGVLLLQALSEIDYSPDFLVYVHKASHQSSLRPLIQDYLTVFQSRSKAHEVVKWSSAKRDRQIAKAHQNRV